MGRPSLLTIDYKSAVVEAVILSGLSNIIAQAVEILGHLDTASFHLIEIAQFTVFAALTTPPNFAFQHFLESNWPARPCSGTPDPQTRADKSGGDIEDTQGRLSIRNTFIKSLLDQSISASVNTLLFIGLLGAIKGRGFDDIYHDVRMNFWTMLTASYRFWPAVCLTNMVMIPLAYRPLVGNIAGLGWNVFLNLR